MGFPSLLLLSFFLVTHLQVVHSSVSCPPSFDCGRIGPIKFPFTNASHPACGLYTVSCAEPFPEVRLGEDRRTYKISSITDRAINLTDPELENLIKHKDCNFPRYINPFNTPSISFAISHNLTVFKCETSSAELKGEAEKYFHQNPGNPSYTGCEGGNYTVYYWRWNDPTPENLPTICHSFQLPVSSLVEDWDHFGDAFIFLTSEFSVEYHLSEKCSVCLDGGGNCSRDSPEFRCFNDRGEDCRACLDGGGICSSDSLEFKCLPGRGGRKRLALILGTVIPGVVLLPLLMHIFWYRKKWRNYFSSCSMWRTSSDLRSKDALEEGSAYFGIPVFSYSELKEATDNFDPSKELGDGGFGTVYFGKLQDGREVAVKRLYEHNCKRVAQFLNEIQILTKLRHPNLVTLYGCTSRHSRELLLVYEYIRNGTVADHLHGDRAKDHPLPWSIRMNIAVETASALVYLHASEIIHRDVKTSNILLDNNFHVKVADFGLSRLFPTDVSHVSTAPQGTPGYVDPDYHQCYQLTARSDVYSFGVVLIELISSLPAVDINRHRHEINLANLAINRIQNGAFNELIDLSLGFESDSSVERMTISVAEVAFRCLQLEKEMRPPMVEVYEALKEIQEYKDQETVKMPPPSPDGDNFELLNCSRDEMTNRWLASNTTNSGE